MRARSVARLTVFGVCTLVRPAGADGRPSAARQDAPTPPSVKPASLPDGTVRTSRRALETLWPAAQRMQLLASASEPLADGDRLVRFSQVHQGIPVMGALAALRIPSKGTVSLLHSSLLADLPPSVEPTIPSASAAFEAERSTGLGIGDTPGRLALVPTREGTRLAWVFLPPMRPGQAEAYRILVDAHTGRVLQAVNTAVTADPRGQVYATNPVDTPTPTLLPFPMAPTDPAAKLSNPFVTAVSCSGAGVLKPMMVGSTQRTVRACELEGIARPNATGDYVYTPNDTPGDKTSYGDAFAEVSMYYHTTRAYTYFRSLMGSPNAQVIEEKPLRAVANLRIDNALASGNVQSLPGTELIPAANAFYAAATRGMGNAFGEVYGVTDGAIWFFQGPKTDFAYDGGVVYHEFVHAVVNATLQLEQFVVDRYGLSSAPGAMNEALADFFSSAMSGNANLGPYAAKNFRFGTPYVRTIANDDACPAQVTGETHYDSTLFSGALWQARETLSTPEAKRAFDAALYEVMRTHPGRGEMTFEELANLFLDNVKKRLPDAAKAVEESFTGRGILPECTRVVTYQDKPLAPPANSLLPGFIAPGKLGLLAAKTMAPGMIQVRRSLSAGAKTLRVSFSGTAAGESGVSSIKPFSPVVLVKWSGPIVWTTTGSLQSNADLKGTPTKSDKNYTAQFAIPDGATEATVQIANEGDIGGTYTNVTLVPEGAAVVNPAPFTPSTVGGSPPDEGGCAVARGTVSGAAANRGPFSSKMPWVLACLAGPLVWIRRRRPFRVGSRRPHGT